MHVSMHVLGLCACVEVREGGGGGGGADTILSTHKNMQGQAFTQVGAYIQYSTVVFNYVRMIQKTQEFVIVTLQHNCLHIQKGTTYEYVYTHASVSVQHCILLLFCR